jgi:hemolysin activation/secretion protein
VIVKIKLKRLNGVGVKPVFVALLTTGVIGSPLLSYAQTAPPDPGRIEQQLPTPTPPSPAPEISVPQREDLTAPPGSDREKFQLKSLVIEGATVYPKSRFESFYTQLLGKEISLSDLYGVANDITRLYRQDGYVLSLAVVPEQTIRDGVARLQVVEGYIEKVTLEGAPPQQLERLKGFGEKIQTSRPLQVKDLERSLLLANDLAGFKVRAILRRGSRLGTSVLVGKVNYDPVNVFGELTNRGTEAVGPFRLQAGLLLNSLLGQGEQITLRGATSLDDPHELALGSANFSIPVGNDGLRLNLGGSYTEFNPGADLKVFGINGRTFAVEAGVVYPVVRSRSTTVSVSGGFDYADSRNTLSFSNLNAVLSEDRLAVLRVGVQLQKIDAQGAFLASAQLSQGVGGSTSENQTEPLSREAGSSTFTKVNFNLSRTQKLPGQFALLLAGKAQLTGDTLLSRELFGLGGDTFGSAFDPDQVVGDFGYGLRAELQRPLLYQALGMTMKTQPYLFADHGQVFRNSPTAAENGSDALSSAGLGIRHNFGSQVFVGLELAFPIQRTDRFFRSDPRLFFVVNGFF